MNAIEWLLDSDPAIRWQVLRDLADAPADDVAAERARVAREGWGARLLAAQDQDGRWSAGTFFPEWISTEATLTLLRLFGLDPTSEEARRAIAPVHEAARWDYDPNLRFFEGEVEPCINGRAVSIGAYFGQDVRGIVDRLLTEQMADGGWNCEQENGSTRGSFDSTLNVLEGLLEYETSAGANGDVTAARVRGEEYLLERRLLRRLSDGETGQERWLVLAFPNAWRYDVARVLDYMRIARPDPDERMSEALDILESKRDADGRWSARPRLPRPVAGRPRRVGGRAEPMDHAPRAARAPLGPAGAMSAEDHRVTNKQGRSDMAEPAGKPAPIVLVPGFWLGAWAWDEVAEILRADGHDVTAITLPGLESAEADRSSITMEDHVNAIVDTVRAASSPVLLAVHSASGFSGYAASDRVPELIAAMVYVDTAPGVGALEPDFEGAEKPMVWSEIEEGENLDGLTEEQKETFRQRAVPVPGGVLREGAELTNDARRDIPSTLICTGFTAEQYQTYAREHPDWAFLAGIPELRNATWIDLPTSHWPMWSRPQELAEIIGNVAKAHAGGARPPR